MGRKSGARIIAGPEARTRLARILKVPATSSAGRGWYLESVEGLWPERVQFCLRIGDSRFAFYLKPPDDTEVFIRTPFLGICFEGSQADPSVERFLENVADRLRAYTFNRVFRIIEQDPEREMEAAGQAPDASIGGPVGSQWEGWREFFASKEFDIKMGDPYWADGRVVLLEYGDRECFFSHPRPDARKWSFFNDPRLPLPANDTGGLVTSRLPDVGSIVVEIDEDDVVMGTERKLSALLDAARQRAPDTELFVMNYLCTPVVIGDDLDGLVERCRSATGKPVVCITRRVKAHGSIFEEVLELVREDHDPRRVPPDPSAVNLFGFPRRYLEEELLPFLSDAGLRVNASLLPELDFSSLRRLPEASHNFVFQPSSFWKTISRVLTDLPSSTTVVPAPYGIADTRACLRKIAAATGRLEAFEAAWQERWGAIREAWEHLTQEAERYRLGFVVSNSTLAMLLEHEWMGVPLLKLIGEMGFGVDVLLFGDRATTSDLAQPDSYPSTEGCDLRVQKFGTHAELGRLLRDGEFCAVYSDIFFDWRLTMAGKSQFSLRNFEMGLAGAVRSLESLLAACCLPFYKRYGTYLAAERGGSDA